jgi:hypothetical protein
MSCETKPPNFLIDEFPILLSQAVENKTEIEKFKNTPFKQAVNNYGEYNDIFRVGLNSLAEDSIFVSSLTESMDANHLSLNDPSCYYLFAGIYHKFLNKKDLDIKLIQRYASDKHAKNIVINESQENNYAQETECYYEQLAVVNEWLKNGSERINYIDADVVLKSAVALCLTGAEQSQIFNETLYLYLLKKPSDLIELLEEGSYGEEIFENIKLNLENPINDGIDLQQIKNKLESNLESRTRNMFIETIGKAQSKYN